MNPKKDLNELLSSMNLKITKAPKPRKTAPKTPRKPSIFDEDLLGSAEDGEWRRFEISTALVKETRFEIIRSARSLDLKVATRTGPVETVPGEEKRTAIFFQAVWKEDE